MKIPIDVEVVMEKCRDCPRLEIDTQNLMGLPSFKCKHVQLCRTIIHIWEQEHPERETTSK